jgi:hypothetical protein
MLVMRDHAIERRSSVDGTIISSNVRKKPMDVPVHLKTIKRSVHAHLVVDLVRFDARCL